MRVQNYLVLFLLIIINPAIAENQDENDDLNFLQVISETNNTEDDDLDFLIQDSSETSLGIVESNSNYKYTVDNTLQFADWKDVNDLSFALPNYTTTNWSNLSRLGLQGSTQLKKSVSFDADILLNAYMREGGSFNRSDDLRLDIKEAYISWDLSATSFLDIGRKNIKNGTATGFNPTDYYKVGTVCDRNTEDISQLQDARVGALMIKYDKLWDKSAFSFSFSPKINKTEDSWKTDKSITGLNLDKSNAYKRYLIKFTHEISDGFSPEFIFYQQDGDNNYALNMSKVLNKKWFAYGEWNSGKRRSLIDSAFMGFRENNRLFAEIDNLFPQKSAKEFYQQLAIGASFTSQSNITTKLEYHYNEAGLNKDQRDDWFNLAQTSQENPAITGQLLSVLGTSQSLGEPLGENRLFMYSSWTDAWVKNLDLTFIGITDLNDSSYLTQIEAAYAPNGNTELSMRYARYAGDKNSIYGSLNQTQSIGIVMKYSF